MIDSDKKDKYPKGELTRWLADAVQQWEAEQSLIDRQEKHESHKGAK